MRLIIHHANSFPPMFDLGSSFKKAIKKFETDLVKLSPQLLLLQWKKRPAFEMSDGACSVPLFRQVPYVQRAQRTPL
jgi:hypothetical protein